MWPLLGCSGDAKPSTTHHGALGVGDVPDNGALRQLSRNLPLELSTKAF